MDNASDNGDDVQLADSPPNFVEEEIDVNELKFIEVSSVITNVSGRFEPDIYNSIRFRLFALSCCLEILK